MKWYYLLALTLVLGTKGETSSSPKPVGVVYLIDHINESKSKSLKNEGISNTIPEDESSKRGVLLVNPIPENTAGDGVYFKPEGGVPVADGQVHMVLHRHPNDIVWYKCSTCSKKFKHKNSLYSHEKRHLKRDDLELYVCNKCPYKTPFKYTLLQHKFNHEPADKKNLLSCSICSYSTNNKYYLSRHVNQTHSDPIYKCLLCDYESKFKANLESHTKRHFPQEEKLYCDFCDYSTNRRYTLALHNRNIHNIYGQEDQLYFCYHCAFETRFKRCLVMHMSMHPVVQDESAMVTRIKTEITAE